MSEIDTRIRILRAAELLFIEHGFEATTLRQITGKAGVNLAAVNYHFGSKDSLIEEVFRQRLGWLNEQCLKELDQLEAAADGAPLRPRQIVEAFFGVALKLAAKPEVVTGPIQEPDGSITLLSAEAAVKPVLAGDDLAHGQRAGEQQLVHAIAQRDPDDVDAAEQPAHVTPTPVATRTALPPEGAFTPWDGPAAFTRRPCRHPGAAGRAQTA